MNITLDLSKAQLSKLRNGHGIRISPAMFGSGTDLIIDPMTYHNMAKKLDKGKGAVITMGSNEIEMNKISGTGLFAGAGNKSGKISRIKKAHKWRDFSDDTLRKGIDTAKYGYEQYQEAVNPLKSEGKKALKGLSKMFGGELESESEDDEVQGGKISFKGIKKAYNKNVKNTKLGKALREGAEKGIDNLYDKGVVKIGDTKHLGKVADLLKKGKTKNVSKLSQMSGLGLRLQQGQGLRMSGGTCEMCGGSMNDKFLFQNQAL